MIGRSWAMLFAGVGYQVTIYDIVEEQVKKALDDVKQQLETLEKSHLLRGSLNAKQQYQLIKGNFFLFCLTKYFIINQYYHWRFDHCRVFESTRHRERCEIDSGMRPWEFAIKAETLQRLGQSCGRQCHYFIVDLDFQAVAVQQRSQTQGTSYCVPSGKQLTIVNFFFLTIQLEK